MAITPVTVEPMVPPKGSAIDFGAVINGMDLENLTGKPYQRDSEI
jgi:hypothetical protein